MATINKPKLEIKKKVFYILLFLIFIYIVSYTVYLLSAVIINTEIYDHLPKNTDAEKKIKIALIVKWMAGKIISYVINCVLVLLFLLYISLGRQKLKLGFIFIVIWITIFIALTVGTHILPGSHDEVIRYSTSIFVSLSAGFIIVTLLFMAYDLFVKRRNYRREIYRVFKENKKGK